MVKGQRSPRIQWLIPVSCRSGNLSVAFSFLFLTHSQLVYRACIWGRRATPGEWQKNSQQSCVQELIAHQTNRFLCSLPKKRIWKTYESTLTCSMHFLLPTSFVIFSHLWLALLFISHLYLDQDSAFQIISTIHLFLSSLKTLCHWKEILWDPFTNKNCPVHHILQARWWVVHSQRAPWRVCAYLMLYTQQYLPKLGSLNC